MKILIIGSGGREHALYEKIKKESHSVKIIGINGGIPIDDQNQNIEITNNQAILEFAKNFDLVIVGPETPLNNGLINVLEENNINC
jgi:phosphoribosylamine-glycine ligase